MFVPAEVILLLAPKVVTLVPLKVIPTLAAVFPAAKVSCKVQHEAAELDHCTPVPVEVNT